MNTILIIAAVVYLLVCWVRVTYLNNFNGETRIYDVFLVPGILVVVLPYLMWVVARDGYNNRKANRNA